MAKKQPTQRINLALVGVVALVALVGVVTIVSSSRGVSFASADNLAGEARWGGGQVANYYEGYLVRSGRTSYVFVNTVENVIYVDNSTFSIARRGYLFRGSYVEQGMTYKVSGDLRPGNQVVNFYFSKRTPTTVALRIV